MTTVGYWTKLVTAERMPDAPLRYITLWVMGDARDIRVECHRLRGDSKVRCRMSQRSHHIGSTSMPRYSPTQQSIGTRHRFITTQILYSTSSVRSRIRRVRRCICSGHSAGHLDLRSAKLRMFHGGSKWMLGEDGSTYVSQYHTTIRIRIRYRYRDGLRIA